MLETGERLARSSKRSLRQLSDQGAIEAAVMQPSPPTRPGRAYAANPKVLGFFVGQVMKATVGKANPGVVNESCGKLEGRA